MKKEELFDLLEDVDRKYINEAMFDDLDGDSPAVARPGKAKISPLKIIAPIAACLAVVIGTGAVVSRLNKPGQNEDLEQQTTQQETIAPNAFVQVDFKDKDFDSVYASNTIYLDFDADDMERDFLAECISIIMNESESTRQDGVSWRVCKFRSSCGGTWGDYFIQPKLNGRTMTDVGVRVFHKMRGYSSIYGETFDVWDHGSLGLGYEDLELDVLADTFDSYHDHYYYRTDTIGSAKSVSLREASWAGSSDEITEQKILEKVVDGDKITYTNYLGYDRGKKISEEEFIGIWNTFPFIPKFYTEFTTEEVDECREELMESLGIPESWHELWRDAEVDLDFDGTKELLLSPQNCDDHKGVYVFAKIPGGIKQVGSFDTEKGICFPEEIHYRNVSADEYFPYYIADEIITSENGLMQFGNWSVNKIVVDENGNITIDTFIREDRRIVDERKHITEDHYWLNGEEVSHEEWQENWEKYWHYYGTHNYRESTVPTDPSNYAWD